MSMSLAVGFAIPALLFIVGAGAGRALAGLMIRVARAEGYPSSRYYSLAGGSRLAGIPIIGHWAGPRGSRCPRLLLLELGGALALTVPWFLFPAGKAIGGGLFLLALLGATFVDLDHMIIPDLFTVGLAMAGLALSAAFPSLHGFAVTNFWNCLRSVAAGGLGLAVGSAIVLWFSVVGEIVLGREVLGFGDVKFLGAIGAFCGWQGAIFAIFGGAMIGAIVLAATGVARSISGDTTIQLFRGPTAAAERGRLSWGAHFPFGPMLAAAAALYFVAVHAPADRYLAQYLALF